MDARLEFLKTIFEDKTPGEVIEMRSLLHEPGVKENIDQSRRFFDTPEACLPYIEEQVSRGWDVYAAIAPRRKAQPGQTQKGDKDSIDSVSWVWCDIDATAKGDAYLVLPPTLVIHSGSGRHVYWKLNRRTQGEQVEEIIALTVKVFGADKGAKDYSRILRVPGTRNFKRSKEGEAVEVIDKLSRPTLSYDPDDILAFLRVLACEIPINSLTRSKGSAKSTGAFVASNLRTPEKMKGADGFNETDWRLIWALKDERSTGTPEGCLDDFIHSLWDNLPWGRVREKHDGYLDLTINKVTGDVGKTKEQLDTPFEGKADGLYYMGERVATFYLVAEAVLRDELDGEDTLMCTVVAGERQYKSRPFPRTVFADHKSINESYVLPEMSCTWLGMQATVVRRYMAYLWEKVVVDCLPEKNATPVAGRHGNIWLTADQVLTAEGLVEKGQEPLVYKPTSGQKYLEAPRVHYDLERDASEVILKVGDLLHEINKPTVIWPVIGWFAATPFKPVLEAQGARFPTLSIYGEPESGKTKLIELMMSLFGHVKPAFEPVASATSWATIAKLSGTNAVPVWFGEHRSQEFDSEHKKNAFYEKIRAAYDQAEPTRGNKNRSVSHYNYIAPIVVDGEDSIEDPATKDRLIVISPSRDTIAHRDKHITEPTRAKKLYRELLAITTREENPIPLQLFAGHFIKFALRTRPNFIKMREMVMQAFPEAIGDRTTDNVAVCAAGLDMWLKFMKLHNVPYVFEVTPDFIREMFTPAVREIVDIDLGFKKGALDIFVRDILNTAALGITPFICKYDKEDDALYFNFTSAFTWWQQDCQRRGIRTKMNEDAIRKQIHTRTVKDGEQPGPGQMFVSARNVRGKGADGVSVVKSMLRLSVPLAMSAGIDVAEHVAAGVLKMALKDLVDWNGNSPKEVTVTDERMVS